MNELLLWLTAALIWVLSSLWFWILVLIALSFAAGVFLFRGLKLRSLEQLEYSRSFSADGVFVGESFIFEEKLHNPTFFPLLAVKVQFFVPAGLTVDGTECRKYTEVTSVFHVPPLSTVKQIHTVRVDKRGHYSIDTAAVRYRNNEFSFSSHAEIYGYPSYFDADIDVPPDLNYVGDRISSRKYIEDPFFLSGIRNYRVGDPMRAINFKATLRSFSGGARQLMSNSYDSSRNFNSLIILDLFDYAENDTTADPKAKLERGLAYTSYLLFETVKQGGVVGFASNCAINSRAYIDIPCGSGNMHTKKILEALAEMSELARRDYSLNALILRAVEKMREGTDLYIITPFVDEKTAETLRKLKHRGFNALVVPLSIGDVEVC